MVWVSRASVAGHHWERKEASRVPEPGRSTSNWAGIIFSRWTENMSPAVYGGESSLIASGPCPPQKVDVVMEALWHLLFCVMLYQNQGDCLWYALSPEGVWNHRGCLVSTLPSVASRNEGGHIEHTFPHKFWGNGWGHLASALPHEDIWDWRRPGVFKCYTVHYANVHKFHLWIRQGEIAMVEGPTLQESQTFLLNRAPMETLD